MKFQLTLILLLTFFTAFAQRQNVYFLKDGRLVSTRDSADVIRIIREPDSGSVLYNVLEYYKNKQPKFVGKSSKIDPLLFEGDAITFYPNGKRKTIAHYNKGLKIGSYFEYYPNGKLYIQKQYPDNINYKTANADFDITAAGDSTGNITVTNSEGYVKLYTEDFKKLLEEGYIKNGKRNGAWKGVDTILKITFAEVYENGLLISGTATDSLGQAAQYRQRDVPPIFKTGIEAFYNYLGQSIVYPHHAWVNGIEGKVFVTFIIRKDGEISTLKVVRGVSPEIDKEALRVLKNSPAWTPGLKFGRQADFQFTIPLTFSTKVQ